MTSRQREVSSTEPVATRSHNGPYQAYLDAIETKTGKTPQEFARRSRRRGSGRRRRLAWVIDWLKEEVRLVRGHAMAFYACEERPVRPEQQSARPQSSDKSAILGWTGWRTDRPEGVCRPGNTR